ncbi:MAG: VCBS domain-containing protein, partial [Polynucleobacter sp.]|nr:VCBS domain-containing protein [Polynucleobacter sp.]
MADSKTPPSGQQAQDAQHLDNMTSLQQPSSAEQSPLTQSNDARGDAPVSSPPTQSPDSPSLFNEPKNPNNKVVQVETPEALEEAEENRAISEANERESRGIENLAPINSNNLNQNFTVQGNSEGSTSGNVGEAASRTITTTNSNGVDSPTSVPAGRVSSTPSATQPSTAPSAEPTASSEAAPISAAPTITSTVTTQTQSLITPQALITPGSATPIAPVTIDVPSLLAADTVVTAEDTVITGNVLTNDSDVDSALSVTSFTVNGSTYAASTSLQNIDGVGSLVLNTNGAYTFTPDANWNGSVPTIAYTTNTGSSSVLEITVVAVNDAAVISGTSTAALTESNAVLTASGTLTVSDVDSAATFVEQTNVAGNNNYGSFSIDANGAWTYTTSSANNAFAAGTNYTDSITVATADGTTQVITVTITGTNDAPLNSITTTSFTVAEDASLAITGLTVSDVDSGTSL